MKSLTIAAVATAALILAACGGNDTAATAEPSTTVPIATSAAPSTTTTAAQPTTTTEAATTTSYVPVVASVEDGDTFTLTNGQRVRLIGVDTPERGQCGADQATAFLTAMVNGKAVTLQPSGGPDDTDKYGRLLRYVSLDGKDAGSELIAAGLAHARYDGLDGYPTHPQQDAYRQADAATPNVCDAPPTTAAPAPQPTQPEPAAAYYPNCAAAKRAGAAPLYRGDPGYSSRLDRDGDGVACES